MDNILVRMRNALNRTGDRITGRHVSVRNGQTAPESFEPRRLWSPDVDIFESDSEVVIYADAPGAAPDNTSVHWDEQSGLSLHVRRTAFPAQGHTLLGGELDADLYRSFELPEHLDGSEARASVRDGVLVIHLPKRDTVAPVAVPVQAG